MSASTLGEHVVQIRLVDLFVWLEVVERTGREGFGDQVTQAKLARSSAVRWVREHADTYGADPTTLFAAGSSAGGHLAAFAALTLNDPTFQPGFESADTSITAVVSLYGYLGAYYGQGDTSSPAAYVRADAPPFFIAQGDQDTFSPQFVEVARGFVAKLRAASSTPVVYAALPGAQHAFDLFHSLRFEQVVDGIEAFTAWVRSTQLDSPGRADPAIQSPDSGDSRDARI